MYPRPLPRNSGILGEKTSIFLSLDSLIFPVPEVLIICQIIGESPKILEIFSFLNHLSFYRAGGTWGGGQGAVPTPCACNTVFMALKLFLWIAPLGCLNFLLMCLKSFGKVWQKRKDSPIAVMY